MDETSRKDSQQKVGGENEGTGESTDAIPEGKMRESLEAENRLLRQQLRASRSRLKGLKSLADQLHQKREECQSLTAKCGRLESSLGRAENRIAQLSLSAREDKAGEKQYAGAIVTPGVSRKVLEAMVKSNTELRQALKHLTDEGHDGVDLALENRNLHEIIVTLRNERDDKRDEVQELEKLLANTQDRNVDAVQNRVIRLTREIGKLKRDLDAKQVFCENVIAENESLKKDLQSVLGETIFKVRDAKALMEKLMQEHSAVQEIIQQTWDEEEEEDAKRKEGDENAERLSRELEEARLENERLQKESTRCAKLVETLEGELGGVREQLSKVQKSLENVGRERDELVDQLTEIQAEHKLMQSAILGYEKDFKIEKEEKLGAVRERDKMQDERDLAVRLHDRLRREHLNLKHVILESYTRDRAHRETGAQDKDDIHSREDVVDATPAPIQRARGDQPDRLVCPDCKKLFPHYLLEDHLKSCSQ